MNTKISTLFYDSARAFVEINFDAEARKYFKTIPGENPLLEPEFCEDWIGYVMAKKFPDADSVYGGYMENRSFLWRESYLEKEKKFIHLGVDVYVPIGVPVRCPVPCRVLEVFNDKDNNGGWGTRVTVETDRGIVVFAHLCHFNNPRGYRVGRKYPAGLWLGLIGTPEQNGGWFPHLHLQGIRDKSLLNSNLDGYAKPGQNVKQDYPNPLEILEI